MRIVVVVLKDELGDELAGETDDQGGDDDRNLCQSLHHAEPRANILDLLGDWSLIARQEPSGSQAKVDNVVDKGKKWSKGVDRSKQGDEAKLNCVFEVLLPVGIHFYRLLIK